MTASNKGTRSRFLSSEIAEERESNVAYVIGFKRQRPSSFVSLVGKKRLPVQYPRLKRLHALKKLQTINS